MPLTVKSTGGGSVTLDAGSTTSDRILSMPDRSGTVITSADSGTVASTMLSSGAPSWDSSGNVAIPTSLTMAGGKVGYPAFTAPTSYSFSTWYQAPDNLLVTVLMSGPYTNDFYVYAGTSSSAYYQISRWGDDINSNTKWSTFSFIIKKGSWFWANTENNWGAFYSFTLS